MITAIDGSPTVRLVAALLNLASLIVAIAIIGDVTPEGAVAQRATVLEALLGQVFLAVLIARLVSVYERESSN